MRYFQGHFQTTENDFSHKIMEKKITFLQIHNTILQRLKQFLNAKMINLEKIK